MVETNHRLCSIRRHAVAGAWPSLVVLPTLNGAQTWGRWMRTQLLELATMPFHANESGYFAPSCLDHGENLELETAPRVGGEFLVNALGDWLFKKGSDELWMGGTSVRDAVPGSVRQNSTMHGAISRLGPPASSPSSEAQARATIGAHDLRRSLLEVARARTPSAHVNGASSWDTHVVRRKGVLTPPRLADGCGDLPCTPAGLGVCNHLPPDPLTTACRRALMSECPDLEEKGWMCDACVRGHAKELREGGCPSHGAPVLEWWCDGSGRPKGHHVCDLSL